MRRRGETLAGIGLATSLLLGASACSGNKKPSAAELHFNSRLHAAAGQLIAFIQKSPNHQEDKPPYTIELTRPTIDGGTITYSVQTKTAQHLANQAEFIEVRQTIPESVAMNSVTLFSFDLSFYADKDGTWTEYCTLNPSAAQHVTQAEVGEQKVEFSDGSSRNSPPDAQAYLDDETYQLEQMIAREHDVAHAKTGTPVLPGGCVTNLGG